MAVDRLASASVNGGSKPVQSMTRDELMAKLSEQKQKPCQMLR